MITPAGIAGMASAKAHAESDAPGWTQRACAFVAGIPGDLPFTMEYARASSYARGLDIPAEERAWGPVTTKLLRDGIIEPVGYAPAASSHGSPKRTYRLR